MTFSTLCKYVESYLYSLNSIILVANYNINHIEKYARVLFKDKTYIGKLKEKLGKIKKEVNELTKVATVHVHENIGELRKGLYPLADIVIL